MTWPCGVKYVKGNALAGEVFDDWGHLEAHVRQWLDGVANVRRHGSTGEMPRVRFERDEQDQLGPYLTPATLASQTPAETRKVDKTGLLSWRANKYSAPMAYQGTRVGVRAEASELVLLDLVPIPTIVTADSTDRDRCTHRVPTGVVFLR